MEELKPPNSPAKKEDTRSEAYAYICQFSLSSQELDEINPRHPASLVTQAVEGLRDVARCNAAVRHEEAMQAEREALADEYSQR